MKVAVIWVVAQCSLVEIYQHSTGPFCTIKVTITLGAQNAALLVLYTAFIKICLIMSKISLKYGREKLYFLIISAFDY
jgi:tetrahydromethanopterin S-methyltransferase subunit C